MLVTSKKLKESKAVERIGIHLSSEKESGMQGQDKELPELAEDIERLTHLAYPGTTGLCHCVA